MSELRAVTKKIATDYARAKRVRTGQVLDELVVLTGWHRDYARAALREALKLSPAAEVGARTDGQAVNGMPIAGRGSYSGSSIWKPQAQRSTRAERYLKGLLTRRGYSRRWSLARVAEAAAEGASEGAHDWATSAVESLGWGMSAAFPT
jgi:hypothetical protein